MGKSVQKTVYSGVFAFHEHEVGFNKGTRIILNDGKNKKEMDKEEFADRILENIVFAKSLKQRAPRVKIIVKVDINDIAGCNEEDICEYKTKTEQG